MFICFQSDITGGSKY